MVVTLDQIQVSVFLRSTLRPLDTKLTWPGFEVADVSL
jgi:hypothetical protein